MDMEIECSQVPVKTTTCCPLAKPMPKSRPVKRPSWTSDKIAGDKKRCRVINNGDSNALKSLRVVQNDKRMGAEMCQERRDADIKHADDKCALATVWPERTNSETMEYFEQLCKRLDTMEPTGTQDSGPNARNPKIPPTWHRQLVEWLLNFPRDADVQNSTIAVAVIFMQRFLTDQQVSKEWLQLLAMVCTFVASKVNESHGAKCVTMRFLTQFVANRRYTANHIKRFERELLKSLKWNLHPVTAHALTMVMLELHPNQTQRAEMMKVANALLDMQLPSKEFLKCSTKAVALGCFSAACAITGFTEEHQKILSQIKHLVNHEAVAKGEELNVKLSQMFFAIFPERSSSPASVMDQIATNV